MTKWEYTHFEYNHDEGYPKAELDRLGEEGWEAFSTTMITVPKVSVVRMERIEYDEIWITYHFKRPVEATVPQVEGEGG